MTMCIAPTRREENRLARQAAILAVARASFLDLGYAATSMSTIATELGGSKGTLWAHFPSKEALFAAVLDDATSAFKAGIEDALRPGRDQRTTLSTFCERFLEKILAPFSLALHRLIVAESGRFPEIGAMFFERGPRQVIDRLAQYLADEMAARRLRQADPIIAAKHLIALLQSAQQPRLWNVGPVLDPAECRAYSLDAYEAFARAYAPDSG